MERGRRWGCGGGGEAAGRAFSAAPRPHQPPPALTSTADRQVDGGARHRQHRRGRRAHTAGAGHAAGRRLGPLDSVWLGPHFDGGDFSGDATAGAVPIAGHLGQAAGGAQVGVGPAIGATHGDAGLGAGPHHRVNGPCRHHVGDRGAALGAGAGALARHARAGILRHAVVCVRAAVGAAHKRRDAGAGAEGAARCGHRVSHGRLCQAAAALAARHCGEAGWWAWRASGSSGAKTATAAGRLPQPHRQQAGGQAPALARLAITTSPTHTHPLPAPPAPRQRGRSC